MFRTCTLLVSTLFFAGLTFAQSIEVEAVQYSLITKKTATWCPLCGNAAWDAFRDMIAENEEKAIPLAAHFSPSSDLYSKTADEIVDNFETSFGQPVFYYNESRVSGTTSAVAKIKDSVEVAFAQKPVAQTGLQVTYNLETNSIKARTLTKFFQPTSGTFYANVYLVEKTVVANQASRSAEAEHKQILRYGLHEETFGQELRSGDFVVDDTLAATFELELESLEGILTDKFQFVVILWQKTDDGYDFVNANRTETVTEEEEVISSTANFDQTTLELGVPTFVQNETVIRVHSTEFLAQAALQVYNLQGQQVAILHQGSLPFGESQFLLNTANLSANGVFIVQLQTGKQLVNKKIIVQR